MKKMLWKQFAIEQLIKNIGKINNRIRVFLYRKD